MGDEPAVWRYSAFISYSHRDARHARALQRALEDFRLPPNVETVSALIVPGTRKLLPVFRDEDELGAAPDLSAAIRNAIAASRYLIVICTPQARESDWVGREIAFARSRHGDDAILAALYEGTAVTAFPSALRMNGVEPLAADFRASGDGARLALLKLVAVLSDTPLDRLVQRTRRRDRKRRLTGVGAASALLTLVGVLAAGLFAYRVQAHAERERGLAAVRKMVDQRDDVYDAGRLRTTKDHDNNAREFCANFDMAEEAVELQLMCATVFRNSAQSSEIADDLADLDVASRRAWEISSRLLALKPADPARIVSHAQSQYWRGLSAWRSGDMRGSWRHFQDYASLASSLTRRSRDRPDWEKEAGAALSNVATYKLRIGDLANAEQGFRVAQSHFVRASRLAPNDPENLLDVEDGYAWQADVERLRGRPERARALREKQRDLIAQIARRFPKVGEVQISAIGNQLGLARLAAMQGRWTEAMAFLENGRTIASVRAQTDEINATVKRQRRMFDVFQAQIMLDMPRAVRPSLAQVERALKSCSASAGGPLNPEALELCRLQTARLHAAQRQGGQATAMLDTVERLPCTPGYSERWKIDFCSERKRVRSEVNASRGGTSL